MLNKLILKSAKSLLEESTELSKSVLYSVPKKIINYSLYRASPDTLNVSVPEIMNMYGMAVVIRLPVPPNIVPTGLTLK